MKNAFEYEEEIAKLKAQLAEQHQGEPVALPARKGAHLRYDTLMPTFSKGWNACLDAIAKLGPLYTPADTGEVERLREGISKHWKVVCDQRAELDTLRAQLAERDGLLRGLVEYADGLLSDVNNAWAYAGLTGDPCSHTNKDYAKALALLSASTELSAPVERDGMVFMVDAAMVEMSNIHPPLRRSECERLIRAALGCKP